MSRLETLRKMLENRPKDALVTLVKSARTTHFTCTSHVGRTAQTVQTARTACTA